MGVLSTVKEEEIEAFLRKRKLGGLDSFVIGFRHDGIVKDALKLLVFNTLLYTMNKTSTRIIAASDEGLVVINPSRRGSLDSLSDDKVQQISWDQVQDFSIRAHWQGATISWVYGGKRQAWTVHTKNPGVWRFNPGHLKKLKTYASGH